MFSPSTSVSPAYLNSTDYSTLIIIYHLGLVQWISSGRSTKWTQSHPTKNNKKKVTGFAWVCVYVFKEAVSSPYDELIVN
jgi:hypothetical protein